MHWLRKFDGYVAPAGHWLMAAGSFRVSVRPYTPARTAARGRGGTGHAYTIAYDGTVVLPAGSLVCSVWSSRIGGRAGQGDPHRRDQLLQWSRHRLHLPL